MPNTALEFATMLIEMFSGYTPVLFGLLVSVFVVAGLVKGVVGLGLPTISMALLSIFMLPAQAAALLVIPSLVTNVWKTRPFGTLAPLLRRARKGTRLNTSH